MAKELTEIAVEQMKEVFASADQTGNPRTSSVDCDRFERSLRRIDAWDSQRAPLAEPHLTSPDRGTFLRAFTAWHQERGNSHTRSLREPWSPLASLVR